MNINKEITVKVGQCYTDKNFTKPYNGSNVTAPLTLYRKVDYEITDKNQEDVIDVPLNYKNETSKSVGASIPTFPVTINGQKVDNTYAEYPYIVHNDITYFPMTYNGARFLGLETEWSREGGLKVSKLVGGSVGNNENSRKSSKNNSSYTAKTTTGYINVNGKYINNTTEKYPLINFNNVTYFPLTWRFAVEEFGWEYSFDKNKGLVINSKEDVTLSSISVKSKPNKTSYFVGDKLSTSGLTLTAKYSDGTTKTISSGFTCSPTTLSSSGTKSVTVTYEGKTTSFNVSVQTVTLTSLSVRTNPKKTTYNIGDTVDFSGFTLTAKYSDGSSKTITSGFNVLPYALDSPGTKKIAVVYGGKTASVNIYVQDNKQPIDILGVYINGGWNVENDENKFGKNKYGDPVDYQIEIMLKNQVEDIYTISSSWDNGMKQLNLKHSSMWKSLIKGNTYWEIGQIVNNGKLLISIYLPDNPVIAGKQYILVNDTKIEFELEYLGDYVSGKGWGISNIEISSK